MCQEEGCIALKPTDQRKATDYFATDVWHRSTGSFDYYIKRMQEKAFADNAPLDALFERDGKWTCVSDLAPGHHFLTTLAIATKNRS